MGNLMRTLIVSWDDVVRRIPIAFTDDGRSLCPVCGVEGGEESHVWAYKGQDGSWVGSPSFDICPECGTLFGDSDIPAPGESIEDSWSVLRTRYLIEKHWSENARRRIRENLGIDV